LLAELIRLDPSSKGGPPCTILKHDKNAIHPDDEFSIKAFRDTMRIRRKRYIKKLRNDHTSCGKKDALHAEVLEELEKEDPEAYDKLCRWSIDPKRCVHVRHSS